MNKKLLFSAVGIVFAGSFLYYVSTVSAQTPAGVSGNIVRKIAQKFNLNQADVQKVFDDAKYERKSQLQSNLENKLNQAVKTGKITDTQKKTILKKFADLKNNKPNFSGFKNKTLKERRQAMDTKKAEFEKWLKDNSLTARTLQEVLGRPGFGFGMKGHMRGRWK